METKTAAKNNCSAKTSIQAPTTKATKKNAAVAKPASEDSKPATKKMSQIEAAVAVLAKSKQPMNCIAMVEAMQVQGLWSCIMLERGCGLTEKAGNLRNSTKTTHSLFPNMRAVPIRSTILLR